MNRTSIKKILSDTAYVRTGGSAEELKCATYLQNACQKMGLSARLEPFPVRVFERASAALVADGTEIPCKGYFGSARKNVTGEFYYLRNTDNLSLKKCKDRIVLVDKPVGYKAYNQLIEHGAKGFISFTGNADFVDRDVDQKELRFACDPETAIPGVNVNVRDAMELVRKNVKQVTLSVNYETHMGNSHNLILDFKGTCDETVVICAHYDSTSLSIGSYDNMSSAITLLYLAEFFAKKPHRRNIRLLWCGSEERGLLGSLAYCEQHQDTDLKNTVLNINLDMLGSLMGGLSVFNCINEDWNTVLEKFFSKHRLGASVRYDIRSSDSNSFVCYGVPAVSFARYAPSGTALIHSRYDTPFVMSEQNLLDDSRTVARFASFVSNADPFPAPMEISERIANLVKDYMNRNLLKKG